MGPKTEYRKKYESCPGCGQAFTWNRDSSGLFVNEASGFTIWTSLPSKREIPRVLVTQNFYIREVLEVSVKTRENAVVAEARV